MKKIDAIFPADRLERVKTILYPLNIGGMVVSHVRGIGLQRGELKHKEKSFFELPKIKLELVVRDSELQKALDLIIEATQTGRTGDGKIFVSNIHETVRIRTGEYGENAV
ncbi:MAG: transcriptional regulator [Elusimicrobia bacterium CG_4_10_14_3_um_filter_49_12_50_7]|nr:MAG: transcriptional regulator [Elusimicrobia bacterium CG03_land_8_20_14_0_80_50_18]PIX13955.1 MAG: transcriptional regulator [Elusimicrobia bacterium CG_4_8_14_3_um_filter_50_9]PIY18035.1 MAG: transcriptional regulator [Elusimicrobia bacterium CG_4_10_14_3_um_filter_49_12_50_7]